MVKHYYRPKPKYKEETEAKEKERLEAMKVHLRQSLEDFLLALGVKQGDPEYEKLVAIWREFHE